MRPFAETARPGSRGGRPGAAAGCPSPSPSYYVYDQEAGVTALGRQCSGQAIGQHCISLFSPSPILMGQPFLAAPPSPEPRMRGPGRRR